MVRCSVPQDRWNTLFWGKDTGTWMKLVCSLRHAHMTSDALVHSLSHTSIWIIYTHETLTLLTVISFTSCSFSHTQQSPALIWPLRPFLIISFLSHLSLSVCKVHLSAPQIISDCSGSTGASSFRSTWTNREPLHTVYSILNNTSKHDIYSGCTCVSLLSIFYFSMYVVSRYLTLHSWLGHDVSCSRGVEDTTMCILKHDHPILKVIVQLNPPFWMAV